MSVINGQIANQTTFNNAFMSRTAATTQTVAKVALENADVVSGAFVQNLQRAVNKVYEGVGISGETDTAVNTYANHNYITDGDNRKIAIGKLDAQLKLTQDDLDSAEESILELGDRVQTAENDIDNLESRMQIAEDNITNHEQRITTIESEDSFFSGNKTFNNNVVIQGDLEVQGTVTSINSEELEVSDALITVNKGGTDGSAEGAGLEIERPSGNAAILFDSTMSSKFKIGVAGDYYDIVIGGLNQIIGGLKRFLGGIQTDTIGESTTNAGVTIDGVLIKDGAINKSVVGLNNVTNDSQLKRAAGDFNTFTQKLIADDDDLLLLEDSTDSFNKKKIKIEDLMVTSSAAALPSTTDIKNLSIIVEETSGNLVISVKDRLGNDPSNSSPIVVPFSDQFGNIDQLMITGPLSITIPSGQTLGIVTNPFPKYVYTYFINDGGVIRLAASGTTYSDKYFFGSVLAISGGASTRNNVYSNAAVAGPVPSRVIARSGWGTLTPGVWTDPTGTIIAPFIPEFPKAIITGTASGGLGAAYTKVTLGTVNLDSYGGYALGTYTAQKEGYYDIEAALHYVANSVNSNYAAVAIRVNGVTIAAENFDFYESTQTSGEKTVKAFAKNLPLAAGDYVEILGANSGSSPSIVTNPTATYLFVKFDREIA